MALRAIGLLSAGSLALLAGCGGPTSEVAAPASSTPSAAPSATSSSAGSTEIDFAVEDCEGCVITAHQQAKGVDDTTWKSAPVRDGHTELVVPSARTARMAFDVTGEGVTAGNAIAVIVLDYRGTADSEGNHCWSGTDAATFALNVRHDRVDVKAGPDEHVDVFWASPALAVDDDNWTDTFHGGLGHQDAPYCK